MFRQFMHAKLHRCTVTRADLDYVGSISIDTDLMNSVGIMPYEKVLVVNVNTGGRFETYAIEAPPGSGTIGVNGGCARLAMPGDIVLIIAFAYLGAGESVGPRTAIIGKDNTIEAIVEDDVCLPVMNSERYASCDALGSGIHDPLGLVYHE
jgi:aspartate 1-decarboxylase